MTLKDIVVLIVEDEPLIAIDLALAVRAARGTVMGPVASIDDACLLNKENSAGAAILDINLIDGDTLALAASLVESGKPVVFYSGLALPADVKDRYSSVPAFIKPTHPDKLIKALRTELDKAAARQMM